MSWRDNEWIRDERSLDVRPAITLPNNNQQYNPEIYTLCKIASSPLNHVKTRHNDSVLGTDLLNKHETEYFAFSTSTRHKKHRIEASKA